MQGDVPGPYTTGALRELYRNPIGALLELHMSPTSVLLEPYCALQEPNKDRVALHIFVPSPPCSSLLLLSLLILLVPLSLSTPAHLSSFSSSSLSFSPSLLSLLAGVCPGSMVNEDHYYTQ
jgi:hypothetical protein